MRKLNIVLFLCSFLVFLEVIPVLTSAIESRYSSGQSTLTGQEASIEHLALLSKQPKIEANQASEEYRISRNQTATLSFAGQALLCYRPAGFCERLPAPYSGGSKLWLLQCSLLL